MVDRDGGNFAGSRCVYLYYKSVPPGLSGKIARQVKSDYDWGALWWGGPRFRGFIVLRERIGCNILAGGSPPLVMEGGVVKFWRDCFLARGIGCGLFGGGTRLVFGMIPVICWWWSLNFCCVTLWWFLNVFIVLDPPILQVDVKKSCWCMCVLPRSAIETVVIRFLGVERLTSS